jgi:pimeloyl-ACP methyl ester carboxylesterase
VSPKSPRRLVRRLSRAIAGTALVASLAVVPSASAADAPAPRPAAAAAKKPTIVLVHGAFADASGWTGTITRLRRRGYSVVAPANPLRSLVSDASYLRGVLKTIKGPVVLVGHSYGGMVITQAAAGDKDVKALVYVAAYMPDVGENVLDINGKFPGSQINTSLLATPFPAAGGRKGTEYRLDPAKFRALFTGPVSKDEAAALAAEQRPIADLSNTQKATAAAWKTIPSWDLISEHDQLIPPAVQRFMAARAHAHVTGVPASHAAMLLHPGATAKVILSAARSVK